MAGQPKPLIAGLGMSMIDLLQVVEEFPSETGVTESCEAKLMGGGPVPTALCAAAQLGANVAIIDRIGDDWRGRLVREEYEFYGVDTAHFQLEANRSTTFGAVLVRKGDGERHVVFSPGDFSPLEPDEMPVDFLRTVDFLHLNGRHWPACVDAAKIVRESGGKVSFDGGANRYEPHFEELLQWVDILIVARDFAGKISDSTERSEQLEKLLSFGAEVAGITDGANGSWFQSREGETFHQPAFPVEPVIDTTGCGDVFHGAFLAEAANGADWKSCAKTASAAAAWNATALGGRGHLPDRTGVAQLVAKNDSIPGAD